METSPKLVVLWVSQEIPFYRYKSDVDENGLDALFDKNRVDENTEASVVEYAIQEPSHGQVRARNELRKQGVFVFLSCVRSIWLRHGLEHFKKRLLTLEKKVAKENLILTESQVQTLERKKHDDAVPREIETFHPGYLGGSQETFSGP